MKATNVEIELAEALNHLIRLRKVFKHGTDERTQLEITIDALLSLAIQTSGEK